MVTVLPGPKSKLRERNAGRLSADLENVILPRFGHLKPAQVTVDAVASLISELEAKGLSGARIKNILKPLNGTLELAARRGLITQNPLDLLTPDERPRAASSSRSWLAPGASVLSLSKVL